MKLKIILKSFLYKLIIQLKKVNVKIKKNLYFD